MALVGNDAAWTQILREQVTILGTDVACKLNVRFKEHLIAFMFHQYFAAFLAYGLSCGRSRIRW